MPGAASPKLNPELPGSALTDQDLEKLASRWIDPKLAACALLRRVHSIDGATLIGREGRGGDYAGIAIPNIFPGESMPRAWRLRRDLPEMERTPNGRLRPKGKYLSAPGESNRLYFPPGTDPQWLADPALPV